MQILEWLFIATLGIMAVILFSSAANQRQMQTNIENAFYKLLEEQDSCISLIQLAASARVDAQIAKQYLDHQIKMLGAMPEVDVDGDTFYRFPKLRLNPYSDK